MEEIKEEQPVKERKIAPQLLSGGIRRIGPAVTPPWAEAALQGRSQDEAAQAMALAVELLRVSDRLTRRLESLFKPHGLSLPRFQILMQLSFSPKQRLSLCDLSTNMLVPPSNLTGLIDRLKRDGLVCRVPDLEDRRLVFAQLTQKGTDLLTVVVPEHIDDLEHLFGKLAHEDHLQLKNLLTHLDLLLQEGTPITLQRPRSGDI